MTLDHQPALAVAGCGHFGRIHLEAYRPLLENGQLRSLAAADPDPRARRRAKREFGIPVFESLSQLLKKHRPDAVSIATPDPFHRAVALQAAAAGCHLLVEKPLATSTRDARAILDAARRRGLLLQVDMHKRYDPVHIALREQVQAGHLGRVLYGYVYIENRIEVPRDWLGSWASRSSSNWFLGVHFYDLLRWVLGRNPVSLRATSQSRKLKGLGLRTPDSVQVHLSFPGPCQVTFHTCWILPESFEATVNQGLRLVGTEGLVEVDTQDRGIRLASARTSRQQTLNPGFLQRIEDGTARPRLAGYGIEPLHQFVRHVTALRAGARLRDLGSGYPTGEDGLWATRIAEAAQKSCARGGAQIRLDG